MKMILKGRAKQPIGLLCSLNIRGTSAFGLVVAVAVAVSGGVLYGNGDDGDHGNSAEGDRWRQAARSAAIVIAAAAVVDTVLVGA